jgi:hypothetical protein
MMAASREPNQGDLLSLVNALNAFDVEYVVIGGAAMALHGFPRMTKDIDLLLPVDPSNNARLLRALESMPQSVGAMEGLRLEWMDKGFSTAMEGEICIDLLYVAASKSFDELRKHVKSVLFNGLRVTTLDVDGMLLTKQTTRASDIPDRNKLERLKNAVRELALQTERIRDLSALENCAGPAYTFWRLADEAGRRLAAGEKVNWSEVEQKTIAVCIGEHGQAPGSVADVLCKHSPGAIYPSSQVALRAHVERMAPELQAQYSQQKASDAENGFGPRPR